MLRYSARLHDKGTTNFVCLCEERLQSKITGSDQYVNGSAEVTNARYRYPESEDHSATNRSKLNEYSVKYKS